MKTFRGRFLDHSSCCFRPGSVLRSDRLGKVVGVLGNMITRVQNCGKEDMISRQVVQTAAREKGKSDVERTDSGAQLLKEAGKDIPELT